MYRSAVLQGSTVIYEAFSSLGEMYTIISIIAPHPNPDLDKKESATRETTPWPAVGMHTKIV